MAMLEKLVCLCQRTPEIKHWLPTREVKIVSDYLKIYKEFPKNLVVRVSAPMIDGEPLKSFRWTSTVHNKKPPIGHDCPSRFQDNSCGDCRACWNKEIAKLARNHNNANIISLPARFITLKESINIINTFIKEGFDGGRHTKRVNKI